MSQQLMPPSRVSSVAAIHAQLQTNGFAITQPFQFFRLAEGAQDKNSISQVLGDLGLGILQPVFPPIEVYKQNNMPMDIALHFSGVVRKEKVQNPVPTTRYRLHVHLPLSNWVNLQVKAVC
jgi:hypothetical protein